MTQPEGGATGPDVYQEEEGWTVQSYQLPSGILRFQAQDIRRERTGIHAKVGISLNWLMLAWTQFNIERDEDRVRLCNSAIKSIEDKAHEMDFAKFPKAAWKHALDRFCLGLWDSQVSERMGGLMGGDASITPADLLLGSYMLREGGTILMAPPGKGKTYTALGMAVSLAWGVEKVWKVHKAAQPLYVNVERGTSSMQARLARVNMALDLPPQTPIPFLNARGMSLTDIYEAAARTIEQERCTYVIYDSISRAGQGSMVADDTANRIMDMLNRLSPGWLAIGHSPRGDESHVYGSQMFDAAADLVIALKAQSHADGSVTGIGLEGTKANDLPLPKLAIHVMEWHGDYPDTYLGNMRRARAGEFSELEAGENLPLEEQVSRFLRDGPLSATDIADQLGRNRSYISNLLNNSPRFQKIKRGREVLFGVKAQETLGFTEPVPQDERLPYH